MYYNNRALLYPLRDILQAKAKVTLKRRLRKIGIVEGLNELPYVTLEKIYNAIFQGK